jgi:TonB-dependent receptor
MLMAFAASARGQSGNGALRGSILDADFSVPVSGATVVIEGAGQAVTTDENGSFFINNLPPGQYTVLASKEGFVRERRGNVVIGQGAVKEIDLEMTAEVVELDEFVVSQEELIETAQGFEAVALRTELKSFTEVLGAQFISQTGATDAAKLLAKTTGVNVSEGKFVVVRGLADRYNSVTLNGLRIPSSDPDRRAVALDLFPSSVIEDVRTSKTFLPNMPGESTGANIDVKTKSVPDADFAKAKVGTGYNNQTTGNGNYLSYNGGGTGMFGNARDRALPGFIRNTTTRDLPEGLNAGDLALRARRQAINETLSTEMGTKEKEAPMDFSLEASMGHRTEFMGAPAGITVAIDYSKKYNYSDRDSQARFTFQNFGPNTGLVANVTRFVGPPEELREFIASGTSPGAILPPSGNIPYGMRVGQETMRAGILVAAGFQPAPGSEITATYFFNRVAEDRALLQFGYAGADPDSSPYRESLIYTERQVSTWQLAGTHLMDNLGADLKVDWAFSYNQSSQLEPDQRFSALNYDLAGGSFTFPIQQQAYFQRIWRELHDQNYNARLDIESDLFGDTLPDGMSAKVRFGGQLDYSDRNYRSDTFAYIAQGAAASYNTVINPGSPNPITIGDILIQNGIDLNNIPTGASYMFRQNDPELYHSSQMISGGYAILDFDLTPDINIVFGARVETTDLKVQASDIWIYPERDMRVALLSAEQRGDNALIALLEIAASPTDSAARRAARSDPRLLARSRANISQVDFLPALAATWDVTDHQRVRGSISQTIARPSFKEIAPVVFTNAENGDFFVGNVDLKLSSITNYDTRWEWFPQPGQLLGISAFAKSITNPIEFSQDGEFTRYINVDSAVVYGFELEFQRDFSFIADELKPFSLGANYSYIQSAANRTGTGPFVFGRQRRLQGQPDYIMNFNLTYDSPDTPWSGGIFLNVTGQQLFAVSTVSNVPDIFQEPVTTLDLGLSYRLNKHSKLTFRASNLTDAELRRVYNNSQKPLFSSRKPGIGYSLSLTCEW